MYQGVSALRIFWLFIKKQCFSCAKRTIRAKTPLGSITSFLKNKIKNIQKALENTGFSRAKWRRKRDSNPRAFWANGFQDRLVVTASIFLHITATHRAAVICREYLHGSEKFIFQNPLRIPHEVIGELAHQWRVWASSSLTRYSVTAFLDCDLLLSCFLKSVRYCVRCELFCDFCSAVNNLTSYLNYARLPFLQNHSHTKSHLRIY